MTGANRESPSFPRPAGGAAVRRVIAGMSGGVDSAAAAYLLLSAGYEVIGVTLRTWTEGGSRCCEIDAARDTARRLGIPYHVINCAHDFRRRIESPFVEAYLRGQTPNPCVRCNGEIKWPWLLYAMELFGAQAVATGHYTAVERLPGGRYTLRRGREPGKDQSYMLYRLTQAQLARTLLPLGGMTKAEVRRLAAEAGLPAARLPDSQEVCFVTRGRYDEYIRAASPDRCPGQGDFTDAAGQVLGRHSGYIGFTVGQRRGLGVSLGRPAYVTAIHPETNRVILGGEEALYSRALLCGEPCFMAIPEPEPGRRVSCLVQIRSHHIPAAGRLERVGEGLLRVHLDTPVRAAAPGQSAVFYDDVGRILGGGVILPPEKEP